MLNSGSVVLWCVWPALRYREEVSLSVSWASGVSSSRVPCAVAVACRHRVSASCGRAADAKAIRVAGSPDVSFVTTCIHTQPFTAPLARAFAC